MTDLPEPLVPTEVNLRDFQFMPLDVVRLRDSDLAGINEGEVFRAAVLSWCAAWHQIPAASLPDDDAVLAKLLGYGRNMREWKQLRDAGALRGYIKCSDGRLYHPVVAEKANQSWRKKCEQRERTEKARLARLSQRQSQTTSQTNDASVTSSVTEPTDIQSQTLLQAPRDSVRDSKGTGTVKGDSTRKKSPPSPSSPDPRQAERDKAALVQRGIRSMKTIITNDDLTRMVENHDVTTAQAEAYGWTDPLMPNNLKRTKAAS